MEKLTEKEEKMYLELQAKVKRIQRQKKQFFEEIDSNKKDVYEHLGFDVDEFDDIENIVKITNQLIEISKKYGIDVQTLINYIDTEKQINYYKNSQK